MWDTYNITRNGEPARIPLADVVKAMGYNPNEIEGYDIRLHVDEDGTVSSVSVDDWDVNALLDVGTNIEAAFADVRIGSIIDEIIRGEPGEVEGEG